MHKTGDVFHYNNNCVINIQNIKFSIFGTHRFFNTEITEFRII